MEFTEFIKIIDILFRSIVSITVLFVLARFMGKKQIAQLNFFDYVVGISIGSISASFAIDEGIPYFHGIIGLVVYAVFPIAISLLSLKNMKARRLLGGVPTILIQNGKLIEHNIKKTKFHINDILEECRLKGVFSITDVEIAILETSGKVSILIKSQKQPLTPDDIKITTSYKGLAADLIVDGTVMHEHLTIVNLNEKWLIEELKRQGIETFKDVLLATFESDGKLKIDLKNHDPISLDIIE